MKFKREKFIVLEHLREKWNGMEMAGTGRVDVYKKIYGTYVLLVFCSQDNPLPSGEKAFEGYTITLDKVDRHQAGVYQCTASNGVGDPVTVDMQLDVLCKYR